MNKVKLGLAALILMLLPVKYTVAQIADSLSLNKAIQEAIGSHPSVLQAQEAIKMADTKVIIAKSSYLPVVEGDATITQIGPVANLSFGGMSFSMAPQRPYSAAVKVNQLIYDFGRSRSDESIAAENKNIAAISLEQAKQRLSQAVLNSYFAILYLQNAKDIKDEQLRTLENHLDFVNKKKATGSATEYELLTTKVRISNIESQKTDILTSLKIQQSVMNTLLGRNVSSTIIVAKNVDVVIPHVSADSLYAHAAESRNEVKIAEERIKVAEMNHLLVKKQNTPTLSAFASGGFQNGYPMHLEDPRMNYAVGISLKVPIFQGNRVSNNALLAQSAIINSQYDAELLRRSVSNEVTEARLNIESALTKVRQLEMQNQQASKALALAEVSYKAGTITNLDLLDATTSLSESQLNLLKARIDYSVSVYKLKVALGENIY